MARVAHVGVLTGGGACPGMNVAPRALVTAARAIEISFRDGGRP